MRRIFKLINNGKGVYIPPELQKAGILVSRIPDIFGRKSGHFQKVATNFSIFGIRWLNFVYSIQTSSPILTKFVKYLIRTFLDENLDTGQTA